MSDCDEEADMLKAQITGRIDAFVEKMSKDFPECHFYAMGVAIIDGKFKGGVGGGTLAPWAILPHLARTWQQMFESDGANVHTRVIDTADGDPT